MTQIVKNLTSVLQELQETWVQPLGQEDPLEKGMITHSRILPGDSNEEKILVGYSPWGGKESQETDVTCNTCTRMECTFFLLRR